MGTWRLLDTCWQCKKALPAYAEKRRGRNQRFCNAACKQKWYRMSKKAKGKDA